MLFNKKEKQETPKRNKQKVERKIKDTAASLEEQGKKMMPIEEKEQPRVQKEGKAEERTSRPAPKHRTKKQEPISVIDTWTGEDMIKGIILSEVLGPPKSKRKK